MGQYYKIIFLAENEDPESNPEVVRHCMSGHQYGSGVKLMEHSYVGNPCVKVVEYLLSQQGPFYKTRLVWAGDYADTETYGEGQGQNLYHITEEREDWLVFSLPRGFDNSAYRYVVNHTKKEYIDKSKCREDSYGYTIHPLPLLVSEGNGGGGGDYRGHNDDLCGRWARDVISLERDLPSGERGFTELDCEFRE